MAPSTVLNPPHPLNNHEIIFRIAFLPRPNDGNLPQFYVPMLVPGTPDTRMMIVPARLRCTDYDGNPLAEHLEVIAIIHLIPNMNGNVALDMFIGISHELYLILNQNQVLPIGYHLF